MDINGWYTFKCHYRGHFQTILRVWPVPDTLWYARRVVSHLNPIWWWFIHLYDGVKHVSSAALDKSAVIYFFVNILYEVSTNELSLLSDNEYLFSSKEAHVEHCLLIMFWSSRYPAGYFGIGLEFFDAICFMIWFICKFSEVVPNGMPILCVLCNWTVLYRLRHNRLLQWLYSPVLTKCPSVWRPLSRFLTAP
jgi:hypothetical protein